MRNMKRRIRRDFYETEEGIRDTADDHRSKRQPI